MHTSRHTSHTILRNGHLYYNRRVPPHAQEIYGSFIRLRLQSIEQAEILTSRLNAIWESRLQANVVSVAELMETCKPQPKDLFAISVEYLAVKGIQSNPTRSTVDYFIGLLGNREITAYGRQDARLFVSWMLGRGRKTTSVRRRLNCLTALFNYAYKELEIDRRNPFSGVLIPEEGKDRQQRIPFTCDDLERAYEKAMSGRSNLRLCVPVLGETGCRIAEIIGLRRQDVDMQRQLIRITAHPSRSLKTAGSEREIPLVGHALGAMERLLAGGETTYLFPAYTDESQCKATHASNALNKWLKRDFEGKTAHCLRHAFRDRLRAAEAPLEMIDALGGWSSVGSVGSRYGQGFDLEHKRRWLERIAV